mgnify:CR=1 FL=1
MLQVKNISISYGARNILENISLTFAEGSLTAVIGRNGCGKSTLLKAMSRSLYPAKGDVLLDGVSIYRQNTKKLARRLAILSQGVKSPEDYTVRRLVCCGRYPYAGFGGRLSAEDFAAVERAMADVGVDALGDRPVATLSGGERQRAWIAMLLAQEPEIMLLDEPTTFLDVGCQYDILRLVRRLNREKGITTVMVLHDLNQAARYADRIVVMRDHGVYADGPPAAILTPELLQTVFGVQAKVLRDDTAGVPYYIPAE